MIIKELKSFKNSGVWKDFENNSKIKFAKKTLIYGFNGSGKTTLTRAFSSISKGEIEPKLPKTSNFSIELSDGSSVDSKSISNPFGNSLLIFNQDFVERNFQWNKSSAVGIVYISELSVTKKTEYDEAIKKFKKSESDLTNAIEKFESAEKALNNFKTAASKRVRELALSKQEFKSFNAGKIDHEYAKRAFSDNDIISREKLQEQKMLLGQDEPLPTLQEPSGIGFDIKDWISNSKKLIEMTPSSVLLNEFQIHSEVMIWAHEGLKYHESHNLDTCLFCGNSLTEDRKKELKGNFDNSWNDFVLKLSQTRDQCKEYVQKFRNIYQAIPKVPELQAAEQNTFKALRPELVENITRMEKFLAELLKLLQNKLKNPSATISLPENIKDFKIADWVKDNKQKFNNLKQTISRHNKAHEDFANQQKKAFEIIKNHVLASERKKNDEVKRNYFKSEEAKKLARKDFDSARKNRDKLSNELSNHGIGAKKLNDLLAMYLGHRDIQLKALEIGYQLVRSNGSLAEHLSEGEKTALAFCYFLTLLESENRVLEELIVVIDDPVSSLDTSARTHAFSLMSRMTKKCAQTIILTHNIAFMNMVKREYKNLQKRDDKNEIISLLSLECTCDPNDKTNRSTILVEMSPLLKDFDTEYHFLFDMVLKVSESGKSPYHYLLPNATRKLLEIFTAFRSPNQASFAGALMEHNKELKEELDIKALERLVQSESHGNLNGLITLPELTIEEAINATKATMTFIEELAPNHFKAMKSMLKKG